MRFASPSFGTQVFQSLLKFGAEQAEGRKKEVFFHQGEAEFMIYSGCRKINFLCCHVKRESEMVIRTHFHRETQDIQLFHTTIFGKSIVYDFEKLTMTISPTHRALLSPEGSPVDVIVTIEEPVQVRNFQSRCDLENMMRFHVGHWVEECWEYSRECPAPERDWDFD